MVLLSRRRFLAAGLGALFISGCKGPVISEPRLFNPCITSLPDSLRHHELMLGCWDGLDPERVWDCHAHLVGVGDSDGGIELSERMLNPLYPMQYVQRLFYLNAGCVHDAEGSVDRSYVARLHNLVSGMPFGFKMMLFAFDRTHDSNGQPRSDLTPFYVPNEYARNVSLAAPYWFEWVCSVHPYREDAIEALEEASEQGARAVKWLPPAMGIDPASAQCDAFYDALVRLDMPLITHVGEERAVVGAGRPVWGNPLRLRRALDRGVRVVMAHCASTGEDVDLDQGPEGRRVSSFSLFRRLMAEKPYEQLLFGDISAITQRNRSDEVLRELLERDEWHPRLLFGSDYPLPGVLPLTSPLLLARQGVLEMSSVAFMTELRRHNPVMFDLALKRHLSSNGKRFAASVFETRPFFDKSAQA